MIKHMCGEENCLLKRKKSEKTVINKNRLSANAAADFLVFLERRQIVEIIVCTAIRIRTEMLIMITASKDV